MMQHYANPRKPIHAQNVAAFEKVMSEFPELELYMPAPDIAPWHVQASLKTVFGYNMYLNFWPCALKAQRDGEKALQGVEEVRSMLSRAMHDWLHGNEEEFQVIE